MSNDPILDQAIAAVRTGDRRKARELITRLLKVDPHNARYWLWMSSVVETPKEASYCLQEAQKYDPENGVARRGLIYLGLKKPERSSGDNLYTKKTDWQEQLIKLFMPPPPEKPKKSRRLSTTPLIAFGAIMVLALFFGSIFIVPKLFPKETVRITLVPPTAKASATYLPTATPKGFRPSPTPQQAPALWMLLTETYTPTPLYVNTPHPSEAYQLAMRAFAKSDWETFNRYIQQELETNPDSADAYYYLGESARLIGNEKQSLMYYEKAMNLDPQFAAAILAHALVLKEVKPKSNILDDLEKAIKLDPYLVDAYLARAAYYLDKEQFDLAMDDLTIARDLNPEAPNVYLGFARIYLAKEEPAAALENARKAYELDITELQTYLVLGTAYISNNQSDKALEYLNTYLSYKPYDAVAYEMVGKAYWVAGDKEKAIENMNKSVSLDTGGFDANYILGVAALEAGKNSEALNYLTKAVSLDDNHYDAIFHRAQALLLMKRNTDSYNQFLRAENLATTPEQTAECVYYQARAAFAIGNRSNMRTAYERLLGMAEDLMPAEWRAEAEAYLYPCDSVCATKTATFMVGQVILPAVGTGTPTPMGTATPPTTTATP